MFNGLNPTRAEEVNNGLAVLLHFCLGLHLPSLK
jgi:hypothetical protein